VICVQGRCQKTTDEVSSQVTKPNTVGKADRAHAVGVRAVWDVPPRAVAGVGRPRGGCAEGFTPGLQELSLLAGVLEPLETAAAELSSGGSSGVL
jgi:hypothetical protein